MRWSQHYSLCEAFAAHGQYGLLTESQFRTISRCDVELWTDKQGLKVRATETKDSKRRSFTAAIVYDSRATHAFNAIVMDENVCHS